jgi:glutaminase
MTNGQKTVVIMGEVVELGQIEQQDAAIGIMCDDAGVVDEGDADRDLALMTIIPLPRERLVAMAPILYRRVSITITVEED